MVELRLEALDPGSLPRDCYVSVRVGDTQKLSKLAGLRTIRFPSGSDQRSGKIEVFKRIGACSVDVDPAAHADREVRIACNDNVGELGLRVHLEADAATKQTAQDQSVASKGAKMKAYKEYLSKHGLEVLLAEAMSAVLRQRPDQPVDFLVEHLKQGKPFPVVEKPVPAPEKPALVEAQDAPKAAISLPVQQVQTPAAKKAPFGMLPSVGTWLVSNRKAPGPINPTVPLLFPGAAASRPVDSVAAPMAAPADAPTAAASAPSAAPWPLKPSVGTWLAVAPRAPKATACQTPLSTAAVACRAAAEPVAKPWALKPSVGTWINEVPPSKAGDACRLVKTCRCLAELGSPKAMTLEERVEVERIVSTALLDMGGSLAGEYFPLRTSKSFAMRPGGMSENEQRTLLQAGLLFKAEGADGRGVFMTSGRDSAVWLNAYDHHVTFVAIPECESQDAVAKLEVLEDAVNEAIRLIGYTLC